MRKESPTSNPGSQERRVRQAYAKALKPRPLISLRDWVSENVVIPEGQPRPGKFRHLVPAADEVMEALTDDDVNTVVLRSSVQTMKTTILVNAILYYARQAPAGILVFEPDDKLSKQFLMERLDPLAVHIPQLGIDFATQLETKRDRVFPGGRLDALSGLAANPQVARTAKYILIDEYRRFRDDLYQSIRGRMILYALDGAKLFATSSAGDHGACRTTQLLQQSDMREWRAPCPDCGEEQPLVWDSVQWTDEDSTTAVYVCLHCHYHIVNAELDEANRAGRWVPTRKPDRPGLVGFSCNVLASPFVPLDYVVAEWIAANKHMQRTGSEQQVRQFFQDSLAEPYRPGAGMRPDILNRKCRIPYKPGESPPWVSNIILSVDVQDDRLEYEFSGWAAIEVPSEQDAHRVRNDLRTFHLTPLTFDGRFYQLRRAGLEYGKISGDPGLNDVWEQLDLLRRTRRFSIGAISLASSVGMVDSGGHHTSQVKAYVNRISNEYASGAPQGCWIYGCKGASQPGQPLVRQSPNADTRIDWGGDFLLLGVDGAKDWCHAMLRASRYAPGDRKPAVYPSIGPDDAPAGYGQPYFESLCAEKKMHVTNRYGQSMVRWVKDAGTPNEALDLFAYSLAGAHLLGLATFINAADRIAKIIEERSESLA